MKIIEPTIILVRPQLPENIGFSARAMQNFGFKKLILVSPREEWPNEKAYDVSANANKIIEDAKIFTTLSKALKSFNYVIATSSRKRFLQKPHINNFKSFFSKISFNKKIAIVFGPENSGLTNKDLLLCDFLFSIPVSKKNKSLNLSHSVAVITHRIFEFFNNKEISILKNNISTKAEFENFMKYLENELDESGFLYPLEKKESMINNIQSMFLRAQLSKTEINTLRGMIKKLVNKKRR